MVDRASRKRRGDRCCESPVRRRKFLVEPSRRERNDLFLFAELSLQGRSRPAKFSRYRQTRNAQSRATKIPGPIPAGSIRIWNVKMLKIMAARMVRARGTNLPMSSSSPLSNCIAKMTLKKPLSINTLVKSPTGPGGGVGIGTKWKKKFEPKKVKTSPSRSRTMIVRIFMTGDDYQIRSEKEELRNRRVEISE